MRIPKLSDKLLLTSGAVLILAGISASVAAHALRPLSVQTAGPSIDLLQQGWQYLNGATQTTGALAISATGSQIVKQDGTGGQSNPAVNLYGTRLQINGDFAVTAHLNDPESGTASLRLYGKPPIIADEFRIEPASIAISLHQSTLTVRVWDGSEQTDTTDPQTVFSQDLSLPDANTDITISRIGKDLTVQAGQATITIPAQGNTFRTGAVWFGASSSDDDFTITKLIANGLNGSTVTPVDTTQLTGALSDTGLQALASKIRPGFKIGTATALGPIVSDTTYANQLFQNFGAITLENAMKPQFISPKQGVYTFQEADALIALAHKNGMAVHGHTLAFGEAEPSWMRNLPTGTDADRQASSAILLDYVTHVVTHFKGQLDTLDVINEPLDTDQGTDLQQNVWYKAMGANYMVRVSQAVHATDPTVKQYVNENGAEMAGDRQDALLNLIQNINTQGGFITGVGLQAHVYDMDTDAINATALNKTFDRFGKAGLTVRISENDVTDDSGTKVQAQQYDSIFTTCLHNSNCVSYTAWGFNDRYDWFIDDDGSLQQGHDLLFNGTRTTSALTAVLKSLQP